MNNSWGLKIKRFAAWSVPVLMTALGVLTTVTVGWRPVLGAKSRPLTNRHYEANPERLAHGKYLVEGVVGCFDCHSQTADWKPGEAPVFTNKGAGRVIIQENGFVLAAPNITPDLKTGAGSWTDDQIARAVREGIGHDGRTLFPAMPYLDFRSLSDEDLASVIVYLRSLPPVQNALPKRSIPFPLSRLINAAPEPVQDPVMESSSDPVSRGRYLTHIAGCVACHTPTDKMQRPLKGMEFAGGKQIDGFPVASANITPDPSGIAYYNEALFIRTLRSGHVGARPLNPPMPWWVFRNMSDDDLRAIFAFLGTVKPVHHRVDNAETATRCKQCNGFHGLDADNGGL